ncbi:MAG: efflux RND transporter permease subunit [Pseudanabaenaceae cyanobacterium bins.68]|nr:efflux RND transporter permease subunit [Pseudanabaenaceae cyanobacterium bins.68]
MSTQPPKFSLSSLSISQHIGTLMLTTAVIVLGVFLVSTLKVDLLPSITYPRIAVQLNLPGFTPEVAVDEVTRPLEESLSSTEGVTQIFSRTQEGRVRVDLFFQPGSNIEQALNDVTATYNRGLSRLPDDIEGARIFKFDPSQLPVIEYAFSSDSLSIAELQILADQELARELRVVPGVAAVDVTGGVDQEVQVNLDLPKLDALGMSIDRVLTALSDRNQDISGGRIEGGSFEPLTRTVGRFANAAEINQVSLVNSAGQTIYLRDFAQVIDDTEKQRVFVQLNGKPAVKISIQKQPDANTIEVVDSIKQKLDSLKQTGLIPADANISPTFDESVFIKNSISNVVSSGLVGALLAAISVLLFLGSLRQTLIIVISIPLSVMAAVILMALFKLSINLFSLGGLALGVGIVVDNSIVMLESIAGGIKPNQTKAEIIQAAADSSSEVESALLASTSTNLVAVLPFLLIGGFISLLFNELILTISFAVAASIVVAATVVPALASRLFTIKATSGLATFWPLEQFNQRFEQSVLGYGWFLQRLLPYRFLVVLLVVAGLGGTSMFMSGYLAQEVLPQINTGQAQLFAQFPPGTTLETNRRVIAEVDQILGKQSEIEYVFSTIGGSSFGNNVTSNPLRSSSTITLKPGTNVQAFVQKVNRQLAGLNLAGIRLRLNPGRVRGLITNNSPTPGTDIDTILQGNDYEQLQSAGRQILNALEEQVKSANFRPDADDRQPEVQILPNWERLQALGLNAKNVGDTIQTVITGSVPTSLQRGNRLVDVRVQVDPELINQPSQLNSIPLFSQNNRQIRLADVAKITDGQAPGEIQRINQRQVYIINGSLNRGASLGQAIAETAQVIAQQDLPEGVTVLPSTAGASNQQLQDALKTLGGLACFLVFVVMAVQYNSLLDPLVIMLTIPLAIAGGIIGLFVTNTAIGATAIVGAVLLVGIVVNNAIIMVELANQIREREKCDRFTAITLAAPQRLRPILMTTITTVLGMLPLAMGLGDGGEFLQPLGIVVFSGLSLATLLTLFIIPCFYLILHELSPSWLTRRVNFGFKRVFKKT